MSTIEDDILDQDEMTEDELATSEEDAATVEDESDPVIFSTEDDLRLLEAVLFASAEPLSRKTLEGYLPGRDIDFLLTQLEVTYANRGVNVVQTGEAWAFRTAVDLAAHLGELTRTPRKLSRAVAETLSIIAYHQPVTRAEIEQIRGVATHKGALDTLVELEWIRPGRRRETLGRPVTWVTTPAFLDHFSLGSLSDLPGIDELRASGLLDSRPIAATLFDRLEELSMQGTELEESEQL
jgi:segregation and condensation protein B